MSRRKKNNNPVRSADVPITQAMLYEVRDELKSHIISHTSRFDSMDKKFESIDSRFDSMDKKFESIDSRFDSMDKKFESIDSRFDSMDKKFESIDSRFDSMDKKFESIDKRFESVDKRFDSLDAKIDSGFLLVASELQKMSAEIHKKTLLVEEQNARNKYVLDQYELVNIRSEMLEKRMNHYENDIVQLINARKFEPKE